MVLSVCHAFIETEVSSWLAALMGVESRLVSSKFKPYDVITFKPK